MKKLLLVALLAIGTSAVSFAQGGGGQGGGMRGWTPEQQLERLKAGVAGITADQETKITAIYTAQTKSTDSLRAAANGDMQSIFPKFQALRTASNAKIKALLTADQAKAWDALPQNQPRQGGPGGGGAPRN